MRLRAYTGISRVPPIPSARSRMSGPGCSEVQTFAARARLGREIARGARKNASIGRPALSHRSRRRARRVLLDFVEVAGQAGVGRWGPDPDVAKAITALGAGDWAGALTSCQPAEKAKPDDCGAPLLRAHRAIDAGRRRDQHVPPAAVPPPADADARRRRRTSPRRTCCSTTAIKATETRDRRRCEFDVPDDPAASWATRTTRSSTARSAAAGRRATRTCSRRSSTPSATGCRRSSMPRLRRRRRPARRRPPAAAPRDDAAAPRSRRTRSSSREPADPAHAGRMARPEQDGKPGHGRRAPHRHLQARHDTRALRLLDGRVRDGRVAALRHADPDGEPAAAPEVRLPEVSHRRRRDRARTWTSTDGMTFSPDGTKIVVPAARERQVPDLTWRTPTARTRSASRCGQPGNNDGVRWRPGPGDAMLFISDRDHPYATGNAGGGFGQELYAMHTDGSQADAAHDRATPGRRTTT